MLDKCIPEIMLSRFTASKSETPRLLLVAVVTKDPVWFHTSLWYGKVVSGVHGNGNGVAVATVLDCELHNVVALNVGLQTPQGQLPFGEEVINCEFGGGILQLGAAVGKNGVCSAAFSL